MTLPSAATVLLSGTSPRRRGLIALAAGSLVGLGHPPFSLVPVSLAGLALSVLLVMTTRTWRAAAWLGWLVGLGHFLVALSWLAEPFLVDVARYGWLMPFGVLGLTGGLALFWSAGFAAARALAPPGWALALAWAASLGLAEVLRGKVLTGFPWAMPGYVWSEGPGIHLAALTGPYGLTFVTFALVAAATHFAFGPGPETRRWRLAALALPWLLPLAAGAVLYHAPPPLTDRPIVRLVQPNAPQHQKWDPAFAPVFFRRQLDYTANPGAPDLIVWPETAIPWRLEQGQPALAEIARAAGGTPVLVGGVRLEGRLAYNAAGLVGAGGDLSEVYSKHHLVPYGEYIPLGGLTKYVGLRSFGRWDGHGFVPGPGARLIDLGPLGRALPLICYEAIFPRDVAAAPARPDVLIQLTNDAWFGTFSGPQQHLAQARFRAVEQGLPMIRVANTGISAVIDATGQIVGSLPLGTAGSIDLPIPVAGPATLYAKTGDWPAILLQIVLLMAVFRKLRPMGIDSARDGA